ncbi:uncharacterized protein LOC132017239 [Mustela nigripes]|uniref:uncharacterized protein LOC132017239 n=1 Tax=Mustela nigripes TaxID=77151 RepID=UPI0028169D17|nr:uncharacterized protein LOC132017239 [Mustela nigripes]
MSIPTHVPIPVSIPEDKLPVMLSRKKRDFGITAAVVTLLAISTAAATAAAVSLAATIPTAEAVNTLAEGMAAALQTQTQINAHLQAGILIVNQRVDSVQEQVDILGALLGLGCIAPFPAICVQNVSRELSQYLRGNWSAEFQNYTQHLLLSLTRINNTRVELATLPEIIKTLQDVLTFTKQWASVIGLMTILIVGLILHLGNSKPQCRPC